MTLPKIIIMLGDSLTDYCSWDSLAPAAKILNQGVPGETAAGMFSRLKRAVSPGPDLIFLQTGINDLAMGRTPAETAASHRKIWQYLSDALPDAILAVCSLAPILPEKIDWHPYVLTQEGVLSANRLIREALAGFRAEYIDLYTPLSQGLGRLPDHFTEDGVHLTEAAYAVWKETLQAFLTGRLSWKLMPDSPA